MGNLQTTLQQQDWFTILLSLIIFAIAGFLLYREKKKIDESGMPVGNYINDVLLRGHVTWILLVLAASCLAEAVFAASIHPVDSQLNPLARFLAHGASAFGGMVMNILLAQRIAEFLMSFSFLGDKKKAEDIRRYVFIFVQLIGLAIVAFAAMYIPYLMYITIGAGLGELEVSRWAFQELLGYDLSLVYQAKGLPIDYNPLSHLSYPMFASYGVMLVHYIFAGYDGWHAVMVKMKDDIDGVESPTNSFQEDIRSYARNPTEGIRYLINMAGNSRDKSNSQQIISDIVGRFDGLSPVKRANIARKLARLVARWKSFEASERGGNGNSSRKGDLISETKDFFRKSMAAGGLERALSNRRQS